jgi:hypothetical protein
VQISEYNKKPLPSIPILNLLPKSSKIQKRRPSSTTDRLRLTCHHGPTTSDAHEVQTTLKSIPDGLSPIDRYAGDSQAHERIALGLESASESTLDEALGKALDEALDEAVDEALDEAVDEALDEAVDEALDEAVDEALDEAVDEAVDEAADEAADENIVLQPWRRAADPKTNGTYRKIRIGISLKRPKRGMSDGPNGDENNRSRKRKPHRDEDEQERKGRKKTPSSPSPPDEA